MKRLVKRVTEVFREGGIAGVARQTRAKVRHLYTIATFRPHVIDKSLAGHSMRIAINNLFAKGWVEERIEWPELEWVAAHMLRPGDVAVDCGANNGFTSVFFAKCVGPQGRVFAFEPVPTNAADVRQNIALNDLRNVELFQAAAGRTTGAVSILDAPNGVLGVSGIGAMVSVPMTSLDAALGDVKPTFIKIDVEGHELEVLAGAQRILSGRPRLDIEVHPFLHIDRIAHARAMFAELAKYDYEIFAQAYPDGPISRCDCEALTIASLAHGDVFHLFAIPMT